MRWSERLLSVCPCNKDTAAGEKVWDWSSVDRTKLLSTTASSLYYCRIACGKYWQLFRWLIGTCAVFTMRSTQAAHLLRCGRTSHHQLIHKFSVPLHRLPKKESI